MHLKLASTHFGRRLDGGWSEGNTLRSQGVVEIPVIACNPDTLLIFLNIFHGRTRSVKRSAPLKSLTELAVLVDYYECHETVEVFSDMWIEKLKESLPKRFCEDAARWLCISVVFKKGDIFCTMTTIAERQIDKSFRSSGLPIPGNVIGENNPWPNLAALMSVLECINRYREKHIGGIISLLYTLLEDLQDDQKGCSSACRSMVLGALTREMKSRRLLNPRPSPPSKATLWLCESVCEIEAPKWYERKDSGTLYILHPCKIRPFVQPVVKELKRNLCGLNDKYFLQ